MENIELDANFDFNNNIECLELIEMRPKGIIAMLDDECMLPKGNHHHILYYCYTMLLVNCSNIMHTQIIFILCTTVYLVHSCNYSMYVY
jgi:myosin heavy subunit